MTDIATEVEEYLTVIRVGQLIGSAQEEARIVAISILDALRSMKQFLELYADAVEEDKT